METLEIEDLSKILKSYSNEWVALTEKRDRVISHGKDLEEVIEKANAKGEEHPVVTKVPKHYGNYVLGI
jgi:hypothetical protein